MAGTPMMQSGDTASVVESKLETLAKFMAGGFTLLASLLTFFGIKEGVLDRILRTDPRASLLVFALVGAGVLSGVIAPVLDINYKIRFIAILIALVGLVAYVGFVLPDIPTEDHGVNELGVVIFVALAAFVGWTLRNAYMPIIAAALVIGIVCLSLGLYGAAKLSVKSKMTTPDVEVQASLDGDTVDVTVEDGDVKSFLLFGVFAQPANAPNGRGIMQTRFFPDSSGRVKRSFKVVLPDQRVPRFVFRARDCANDGAKSEADVATVTDAAAVGGSPDAAKACRLSAADNLLFLRRSLPAPLPVVGGEIASSGADALGVKVNVTDVPRNRYVILEMVRVRAGESRRVFKARLIADAGGAVTWDRVVQTGARSQGDMFRLRYALCRKRSKCAGTGALLATYAVLK